MERMILLPVIERELRTAARQPFTYHVRVLGVLALLAVLVMFGLHGDLGPEVGGQLLSGLHAALFFAIWLLVSLLTADCISRERREGTLPLLFLTPLKAHDIVWAKGTAHGLRALTLWLAVAPILGLCLVVGGVGWAEMTISVLVNFSSICLATAAGLLASARSRAWTRALALAGCLAIFFLILFLLALSIAIPDISAPAFARSFVPRDPEPSVGLGFVLALGWEEAWQGLLSRRAPGAASVIGDYVLLALCSMGFLLLAVRLAAWIVKRSWQEQPASARVLWWKDLFFKPTVLRHVLRRWLHWELQRNPIGWLERRSWSGRLVVWSWLAVVVCIYSSLFTNPGMYQRGFHELQTFLAILLAISIAISAAGSFRRERETGVLELLLVAPLREWQIIAGRVRGLWSQFLPSVILLCAVWMYCATFLVSETASEWPSVLLALVTFVTLPVVGLYFSLTRTNFMAALLWTVAVAMVVPSVLAQVAEFLAEPVAYGNGGGAGAGEPGLLLWLVPSGVQVLVAALLGWRLEENLRHRRFAVEGKG
jgi:ABC-type transport system involved in multi-copper enzyme maturation permease subunit